MPLRLFAMLALVPALLIACSDRDDTPEPTPAATAAASAAGSGSPSPTLGNSTAPATRATPTTVASHVEGPAGHGIDRTIAHVEMLTQEIGERVSGTSGEEEAVDYIAAQFRSWGYDVEVMSFEFSTGGFADDSLTAGETNIASRRFNGTGNAEVSAQAVFVGIADTSGLAGKDLAGKIAVADRGTLTFTDKWNAVSAAGAVGMIVINTDSGLFAGRIDPAASGPVVGVSNSERSAVLAAADSGKTFELKVSSFPAKNVIARPSADAECRVLVGGHHDTVPAVVGATDNASGTANVLELARAYAVGGLEPNLCFATFGAEESGLHGSEALVEKLEDEGDLPLVYLNLDVTATGTSIEAIGDIVLADEAVNLAGSLGMDARATSEPAGTSSDHASFRSAGVRVLFLASDDFSTIHTPGDTIDTFNVDLLDDIGDLAYELIAAYTSRFARG